MFFSELTKDSAHASPAIDFPHYAKLGRVSILTNLLTGRWSTTRNYGGYLLIYHGFTALLVNIPLKFEKLLHSGGTQRLRFRKRRMAI